MIFRIFDTDYELAQKVERFLFSGLKARGIKGKVYLAFEYLEFSRMKLKGVPALELNGTVLFQNQHLTRELLNDVLNEIKKRRKE